MLPKQEMFLLEARKKIHEDKAWYNVAAANEKAREMNRVGKSMEIAVEKACWGDQPKYNVAPDIVMEEEIQGKDVNEDLDSGEEEVQEEDWSSVPMDLEVDN